ncbi:N-succinylarginine dihydrolase [Salinisphaera orenii]|uniref:N-succinylarginine dihydrolase n=1 Tax=Salinisphaera orenii TaxID=856731 RepID=UPI00296E7418
MMPKPTAREVNFDGLVGPTHNYSGLAHGNLAAARHQGAIANPRAAALQGLAKMKALHDEGFAQAVLPPHHRPNLDLLRRLGFAGGDTTIIRQAEREAPQLLRSASSAAAMWTANAATVTPSADSADARVHFTPANLQASLHRSLETETTAAALSAIFADEQHFSHHPALPATSILGDEGAANHTRLCEGYAHPGIHLFVYGRHGFGGDSAIRRFSARQSLEASQAIARQHGLTDEQCVFSAQHPGAIDAGAFHNDVIAVGNGRVLFYHEYAFADEQATLDALSRRMDTLDTTLCPIRVSNDSLPLQTAISTYLFNSQLLSREDGSMMLIVPAECDTDPTVAEVIEAIVDDTDNPITEARAFDIKQSMDNGGGPACLRLRVVLTDAERDALGAKVMLDDARYETLCDWVRRHYRDRLAIEDLADPALVTESAAALDELSQLLQLGSIYPFQRT